MVKVVECRRECKRSIKEVYRKRKAFQKRKIKKWHEAVSGGFRANLEQNYVQTLLAMKKYGKSGSTCLLILGTVW